MEKTVTVDVIKSHPKIIWTSNDLLVISLKDCIRKIKQPAKAICTVCCKSDSDLITCSKGGLDTMKQHIMGKGHASKVITEMQCYKLPGTASAKFNDDYGAPHAYYGAPAANKNPPPQAMLHVSDLVMNQEAMVAAFLAEKSLGFSMKKPIIDMAQELSKDPQALTKLYLFRTMPSDKMVYGTGLTFNNNLVKTLQTTLFALSMDEVTASNNSRVCAVFVTYSKGNNIITENRNSCCQQRNPF